MKEMYLNTYSQHTPTTTELGHRFDNMSKSDTPGAASSSGFCSSSDFSSAENLEKLSSATSTGSGGSTVESTHSDLFVFTFLVGKSIQRRSNLSLLPEIVSSSTNHRDRVPCNQYNCSSSSKNTVNGFGVSQSSREPHRFHNRSHSHHHEVRTCNCVRLDDVLSSFLSQCNLDGYLLRSLEKGVLYPAIHWSPAVHSLPDSPTKTGSMIFNQGVYKELKRVIPSDAWINKSAGSDRPSSFPKKTTWIVIGYKSLEKTLDPALEATWKEWTGARHIYLNLRHDFDIQRISFFNRVHPQNNLDLFMYLVCMEVGNVEDRNVVFLLDFIQRTRAQRMKGFLTVYTEVDGFSSTVSDELIKHFVEEENKTKAATEDIANLNNLSTKAFIEKILGELQEPSPLDYC